MAGLRVPGRAWSAVVALVVLASVGITVVLAAGLQVWRGTVGSAPAAVAPDLFRGPGSGIVTVPGHPRHTVASSPPVGIPAPSSPAQPPTVVPVTAPGAGPAGGGQPVPGPSGGASGPGHERPGGGGVTGRPTNPGVGTGRPGRPAVGLRSHVRHLLARVLALHGAALRRLAERTVRARGHVLRLIARRHLEGSPAVRRYVAHRHAAERRLRHDERGHPNAYGRLRTHGHGHGHGHAYGRLRAPGHDCERGRGHAYGRRDGHGRGHHRH